MARKKRTLVPAPSLPLSKGEIWEVGRRTLEVSVADLARKGERPEVLLVVQAGEEGGVVLGDAITSSAPYTVLADIVVRAMREPLIGKPRRPEVIRVGSAAEAELLATSPAITGVALEVVGQLVALERFQSHMELQLGGLSSDYRTQAARAGETLSAEGLHTFFRTARQFYREAMWEAYSDGVMFVLTLQAAQGASKTLYGIIIGALGQELGLACILHWRRYSNSIPPASSIWTNSPTWHSQPPRNGLIRRSCNVRLRRWSIFSKSQPSV